MDELSGGEGSFLGDLVRQASRFGVVGAVAFVIDVLAYNVLVFGLAGTPGPMAEWPLLSKGLSVAVAAAFTWFGNRTWAFREGIRRPIHHELVVFALVNMGGLLIAVGALGFSRHVLHFEGQIADNISGNIVGFLLATIFRFWGYRVLVFRARGRSTRAR